MTKLTIAQALERLRASGQTSLSLHKHGLTDIKHYKPETTDGQTPHLRDEVYVVANGTGKFICAGETRDFAPGDLFFVPAGIEHRFLDFSDDFSTWVIFHGELPKSA